MQWMPFYITTYLLALGCVVVMVTDQLQFYNSFYINNGVNEYNVDYYLNKICVTLKENGNTANYCFKYGVNTNAFTFGMDTDFKSLYTLAICSLVIWIINLPLFFLRGKYSGMGYILLFVELISAGLLIAIPVIENTSINNRTEAFSTAGLSLANTIGPSMIIAIIGIILMIGTSVLFYLGEVRGMGK